MLPGSPGGGGAANTVASWKRWWTSLGCALVLLAFIMLTRTGAPSWLCSASSSRDNRDGDVGGPSERLQLCSCSRAGLQRRSHACLRLQPGRGTFEGPEPPAGSVDLENLQLDPEAPTLPCCRELVQI